MEIIDFGLYIVFAVFQELAESIVGAVEIAQILSFIMEECSDKHKSYPIQFKAG